MSTPVCNILSPWTLFSLKSSTSALPSSVALSIPEILEHIFSFLSPRRRHYVVALVCKQWLAIVKRFALPPPVTWPICSAKHKTESIIQQLPSSHILHVRTPFSLAGFYPGAEFQHDSWMEMIHSLEETHLQGGLNGLKEFWFSRRTGDSIDSETLLPPIFPLLSGIKTLRLDRHVAQLQMSFLHMILVACPGLVELFLEPSDYSMLELSTPERVPYLEEFKFPVMTKLQTLAVYGLIGTLEEMKGIIVACPRLTNLKIIQAWSSVARPTAVTTSTMSRSDFFRFVANFCPNLDFFHFSTSKSPLTMRDISSLFELFPERTNWSFADSDAGPAIHVIRQERKAASARRMAIPSNNYCIHERLTSLNLYLSPSGAKIEGKLLHDFLCSSPHLQHLTAPYCVISDKDLDINDLLPNGCYRETPVITKTIPWPLSDLLDDGNKTVVRRNPHRRSIWACRRLRTLHMTFDGPYSVNSAPRTLLLFGYLSRVCPHLEELYVRREYLTLSFLGGLCLLTRLKNLERLKITTRPPHGLDPAHIEWIRRYPTMKELIKRPIEMYLAKRAIGTPSGVGPDADPIGIFRDEVCNSITSTVKSGNPICNGIDARVQTIQTGDQQEVNLRMLGRAEDLTQWMKERNSVQEPCWPKMESFVVEYQEYMHLNSGWKATEFVKSVRPEIDFRLETKCYQAF